MRKRFYLGAGAVLALMVAVPAVASAAVPVRTSTTVATALSPNNKAPKFKRIPARLRTDVEIDYTCTSPPGAPGCGLNGSPGGPFPTYPRERGVRALIEYDNDIVFNFNVVRAADRCPQSRVEGLTTAAARNACPKAILGGGSAATNGAAGPLPAVVTAFAGTRANEILLFSRTGGTLPATTILPGLVIPSPLGGDYGSRLDVAVPDLGGSGGAQVITHFDTTVNKKRKVFNKRKFRRLARKCKQIKNKRKRTRCLRRARKRSRKTISLINVRCRDNNRQWNYRFENRYIDSEYTAAIPNPNAGKPSPNPVAVATSSQGCLVKR